jgi:ABC-type transporter MlaC component
MPFENSLPLVLACLALAGIALFAWTKTISRLWLIIALLAATAGIAAIVSDRLIETDREHLQALFPRLAAAAERQDIDTILASLDPELRPLRADAEKVLKQVRPTEVVITKLDVTVDAEKSPPAATADMIVRVSGNVVGEGTPGTVLVGLRVEMLKKGGKWLVRDAGVQEPGRPGRVPRGAG